MSDKNVSPADGTETDAVMPWLTLDPATGGILFGQVIIGEYDNATNVMTLNAGWCRLAGLGLRVEGDPRTDRKRVVFERPVTDHTLASRS